MISSFLKVLILALFALAVAQDAGADCAGEKTENGECINPEAEIVVEPEIVVEALQPEDPKCPSRRHIIACTAAYLDLNKDSKLDREELDTAVNKLPWLARGVLKIIGSTNTIMKKCDVDGDDAISMDYDMKNNAETCLATCFKRRAFKGAFFSDCDL